MKRTWTIIGVADVARSFEWYQSLFGQPKSAPEHDYFGQILDEDGTVLLCLHECEHPTLASPDRAEPGNGLLLFFRVDDFDQALTRARSLVDQLEEEPQTKPTGRSGRGDVSFWPNQGIVFGSHCLLAERRVEQRLPLQESACERE